MSRQLINRSADLKALMDDGYEVEVTAGYLVIHNVPYVSTDRQVKRGKLVSTLDLAGDVTTKPSTHIALFSGDFPCNRDGSPLRQLEHKNEVQKITDGLIVDRSFSNKPKDGYADYYAKMTTYIAIISGPAQVIDPDATARTHSVMENSDPESPFNYIDNASSRAGINAVSRKLEVPKVVIVGLGGTGSYVLDLIAKTPAGEIHLYDGDYLYQHNAFRTPGAASVEQLKARQRKVEYLAEIYSRMHRGIVPHPYRIDETNVGELQDAAFVFLCVDNGAAKRPIVEALETFNLPFIDVGMGIELFDDKLQGLLRVTTSAPGRRDHVHAKGRISFDGGDDDGVYSTNIQVADLNALNAALAVVRFKRYLNFYADLEGEYFSVYTLDGNRIDNADVE